MTFEEWWESPQNDWLDTRKEQAKAAWEAGMNTLAKAHQIRPRGKSITSGYVIVPVEPTEAMLKAGEQLEYFEGGFGSTCDEFYKAMIRAAQEEE